MAIALHQLASNYQAILSMVDDGLDEQVIVDTLESIQCEITVKVENTGKILREMDATAEMIKSEEKRLAERRKALENYAERIKAYVKDQMTRLGVEKVKTPLLTVSVQNNPPAVEILQQDLIPARYITVIPEQYVPDKKAIAQAIKAGEEVPGCRLTQGKSLRIR